MESSQERYQEIISTLPQENGWKISRPYSLYEGFWCLPHFLEGFMFAQDNFKAQSNDIILCSSPKTGTTWLKALTFATVSRNLFDSSPLLTKQPHDCIPFLELDFMNNNNSNSQCWATHVPYSSLPNSIINSSCKIIYICRDPKDAFVSLWHFTNKLRPIENEIITIEEAFDLFCRGRCGYGPYWDYVLGYWKASLESPNKVLFLKYEDVMRETDTVTYVKRLAEFLGCPFSMEEEINGVVEKTVGLCSFENLSNLEVNKSGKHRNLDNNIFFRKGKVGDWRNYLTPEMSERLDNIVENKLSGSGFTFNH